MNLRPLILLLAVSACVSAPPRADLAATTPRFDPARFFTGRTEGEGVLRRIGAKAGAVHVHGNGHMEADGTLVLDQTVEREEAKPEQREWRLHEAARGRWTGTLTDAKGAVTGTVEGNLLHLSFGLKGPLTAEQFIYLAADGQSARNQMTIRMLGLPVAALEETIRRVG